MDIGKNWLLIKVIQLIKTDIRKYGSNEWHMVLSSNLVTNDTLNLPDTNCCKVINTSKGLAMKSSLVINKMKKEKNGRN